MDTKEQLAGMHSEHAEWQNKILEYRNQLNSLNENLESIVLKAPPREISPEVEQFQNQFIRQNEVLDIMRHDFKQYENGIEFAQKNLNAEALDKLNNERKINLERLNDFDRIFNDLKIEYRKFESPDVLQS